MAVGSFSAALSGLSANAQELSVIGNNLANINTVAYKESDVSFQDLVSQNAGGNGVNPAQIGVGTAIGAISPVFSQGAIESTTDSGNVAIQGNGFFLLNGPDGKSYTRAGTFTWDSTDTLVTPDGQKVQGYTSIDPTTGLAITTGSPSDITVPKGRLRPPVATTQFENVANLEATDNDGSKAVSSNVLYDALGAQHNVGIIYSKTSAGHFDYSVTVPGSDVVGGTAGVPYVLKTGKLTFSGTGQLATVDGSAPVSPATANVPITTPAWTNGASASNWTWELIDDSGKTVLTNFTTGKPSGDTSKTQNGSAAGTPGDITVSADGTLLAPVGGGQTIRVGQLALATFNNPRGLTKLGGNRYGEGAAAGTPNVGVAGSGGRGTLVGSALEQSNVDMAQQFTKMILAQRGYQANGKMITTSDEVLQITLQLKQ